ncbi:hypothetical protein MtrunA17_Chr4g0066161 [Medicago truncatula]|uniref:Uncharacterized protein n=1 Tax=Medicago truncatula TaxID=3880 RepID=A0A396IMM8_MEDTR|nr:hypothetical protein MtrunA17_Chr4g0066161 [Medicago truncatula]
MSLKMRLLSSLEGVSKIVKFHESMVRLKLAMLLLAFSFKMAGFSKVSN